jgi:23S rRNA (adenine2503-C2)-methyltransferase
MEILLNYSLDELKDIVTSLGEKSYRAKQLYLELTLGKSPDEIKTIPKSFLSILEEKYIFNPINLVTKQESVDGTIKFGFSLFDNNIIESVLMKYKYGYTLCISTQVGCAMGCAFCASTINGKIRNLEVGELLGQVIYANKFLGGNVKERKITNIVLMGCGEPLDNYDNVVKFLKIIASKDSLNISPRNISLSTCGLVPKIKKLAEENIDVTLTISLHAPNDEIRKKLMKVANVYTIKEVLNASDYYFDKTKRRVYYEYSLVKGINDSLSCADELSTLLKGKICHVNVINLNAVKEKNLLPCSKTQAYAFVERLNKNGISATLRRTLGADIDGACGQLRRKLMEKKD